MDAQHDKLTLLVTISSIIQSLNKYKILVDGLKQ